MSDEPIILWFRNDLRLTDHKALHVAAAQGPVLPVFVVDDQTPGRWAPGAASRWWLHHSLASLAESISQRGGELLLLAGSTVEALAELSSQVGARGIYFSRAYEPWAAKLEQALHARLGGQLAMRRFSGQLLLEPGQVATKTGGPYRVFTPFWKCISAKLDEPGLNPLPKPEPSRIQWSTVKPDALGLSDVLPLPSQPDWAQGLAQQWQPGEQTAGLLLHRFHAESIDDYPSHRDRPDLVGTSGLSAHLHFGEISPRQVWHSVRIAAAQNLVSEPASWAYLRQLAWREFCHHLLAHWPDFPDHNFKPAFDAFPWREDEPALKRWQQGMTGYPMVDAGMRQLWHSGWMHNRVRMITASFLIKHLMIDWRHGAAWFWDTLVDANLANNSAGWQWVSGSGADASPYFRIFNPITQGEKFDPNGDYVRRWVPELAALPNRYLGRPWQAPEELLRQCAIELGRTYPQPIVDHQLARQRALDGLAQMKGS